MSEMPLWEPSAEILATSPMALFMKAASRIAGRAFTSYDDLHAWSVEDRASFWTAVWDDCGVIGEKGGTALENGDRMLEARFFPEGRLNFAENLLKKAGPDDAVVFRGEDKVAYRWSWDELRARVSKLQQAFAALGIGEGDRVAAMMPNMPETIACMLAATSLGAIWSSCSPDFGEQGVFDRFGQIEPKLFIACDAYWYAGKLQNVSAKVQAIAGKLGVPVVVVHYAGDAEALAASLPDGRTLEALTAPYAAKPLTFAQLPFRHPLYILFSSGTTGVPKCIVHSAGGTLLQHLKEHHLHCGLVEG